MKKWSIRTVILGLALALGITVLGTPSIARAQEHHDWDRDHDRGGSPAREEGFRDGLNDGTKDRQTGHSFRPTHDDNYKNADRGYNSSFGDKNQYKQEYREAYERGYNQGYNGEGQDHDRDYR